MIIEILIYLSLGAFTGLLAGMFGIGGGSILVPSLIFIFYGMGFESSIIFLMAIGTSLASIFFSAISSALSHHKKRSVEWPLVVPLSVGMILGAVIGAKYAATLTNENLKWIITIFLIVIGIEMIFNFTKSLAKKDKKLIDLSKSISPIHGSWIGFLSSIIGIGGGSFTTPLMIAGGYNIRSGIGTAAACGVPIAAAGAIGYMYFGQSTLAILPPGAFGYVFWPAVISISFASILTARIGANISHSISEKDLKISFGTFFNFGWYFGNNKLIIELSDFFNNPSLIEIGWFRIQYYAVTWILSAIFIFQYLKRHQIIRELRLSSDQVNDIVFLYGLIFGAMVGGRFGYMFFYGLDQLAANPLSLFFIWEGGLSFHGGLIGVILSLYIYCYQHKISFLRLADSICIAMPIGLGLVRIGNFMNGELFGRPTDGTWGFIFPTDPYGFTRHPSQLYEAFFEGLFLFILLMFVNAKNNKHGVISGTFLLAYGAIRFFVEYFRQPDSHMGFVALQLSMGQLLSIPMVIIGLLLLMKSLKKNEAIS